MVAAADAERRRIERDLHGAQQRLVALAMTLGRAKAPTIRRPRSCHEAHRESKEALVDAQPRARHPPRRLTDRGLDAAVSALAARCLVPGAVDVDSAAARGGEAIAGAGCR